MHRTGQVFLQIGIWLGLGVIAYVYFEGLVSPPARILTGGEMELTRSRDGHFHIDGEINGNALRFLIDTGASTVSVSADSARQMGLACQRQTQFQTANGAVRGCVTRVQLLGFGPFQLRDMTVAILPDLAGEALLGMNALKHLHLEQSGDKLRLTP